MIVGGEGHAPSRHLPLFRVTTWQLYPSLATVLTDRKEENRILAYTYILHQVNFNLIKTSLKGPNLWFDDEFYV